MKKLILAILLLGSACLAQINFDGQKWNIVYSHPERIESVQLKDGKLYVHRKIPPQMITIPEGRTEEVKDIYVAKDGKIILLKTISPNFVPKAVTNISDTVEMEWKE